MRYDPFTRGRYPVGVRTIQALDAARDRLFPCEIWYPAAPTHAGQDLDRATQDCYSTAADGPALYQAAVRDAEPRAGKWPLILFSHSSGGRRRQSTFLCTHLGSHGYVVAAADHSETVAAELAAAPDETAEQKAARIDGWIASRVPDVQFLLDWMLEHEATVGVDRMGVGIVGHSFGGWTALAAPDVERRIRAVVALAPGGSSRRRPGILSLKLDFAWERPVPTLYLVAENDISLPFDGMVELFERTPPPRRMVILRRADHLHFMDNIEQIHEAVRGMTFGGELAWIPREMRPIAELCSGAEAQLMVRGLTLCHMDATLRRMAEARQLLEGDVEAELRARGVEVLAYPHAEGKLPGFSSE